MRVDTATIRVYKSDRDRLNELAEVNNTSVANVVRSILAKSTKHEYGSIDLHPSIPVGIIRYRDLGRSIERRDKGIVLMP